MNDIDFDELDRAVSSLIGNGDKKPDTQPSKPAEVKPEAPASPATSSLPTTSNGSLAPSPKEADPSPVVASISTSTPMDKPAIPPLRSTPAAAPAVRRAGRFMDVVPHRPQPATPTPVQTRQESTSVRPKPTPQRVFDSLAGISARPVTKEQALATPPAKPVQHPSDDEELLPAHALSHPEVKPKEEDTPETKPVTPAVPAEDTSPSLFLSGTKVEKRPLGAFANYKSNLDFDDEPKPTEDKKEEAPVEKPAEPEELGDKSLPAELDQRVVAVEAGDFGAEESDTEGRPDTPPAFPPEPTEKPHNPWKQKESEVEDKPAVHKAALAVNQSIPTQYKAKHGETDMTTRPIFDTKDYHQPITAAHHGAKPAHKPWFWALVVLLLLALGAGLGVGAYFLLEMQ